MILLFILGTPGLDLAEGREPLVLVSSATDNAAKVGSLIGDTIMLIIVGRRTFYVDTKGFTLEEIAEVLTLAASHAVEKGLPEVDLEIIRLIKVAHTE